MKEKKRDNFSPDVLAEAISRRPIVLLGDVGVGKTSFVKNLMYNSAYTEFQNAVYIYINLGSSAALAADFRTFVLAEIERRLVEDYNVDIYERGFVWGVYASEISRFSRGIWAGKKDSDPVQYETKLLEELEALIGNKDQHIRKSLSFYSRSTNRQVIVSLDNADQRDFDIQQSAFLVAQEIAKEWNAAVFVAVRPQTFFRSKRSGALAAYPHKVFTISPPRIDLVIEKRLEFALSMAEGRIPVATMESVTVNSGNLAAFIRALLISLKENREIVEFLTNITGGNVRAAVEFVTHFMGNPNVNAEKIIDIMSTAGRYRIPMHEFTKAALLGEFSHYHPDTSIAMNVFDVSTSDQAEHFLALAMLAFLDMSGAHRDKDGFVATSAIFGEMQNSGYTDMQVESTLRRMTNKKLVETSQRVTFDEDLNGELVGAMPLGFRASSIGVYHLRRWPGSFAYLDAMVFDTPVFDQSIRTEVAKNVQSFAIEHRYRRATLFRDYLSNCWSQLSQKPSYLDFAGIMSEGRDSFGSVETAIARRQQES